MTLGERCDEIVRLIDETLADIGVETAPATDTQVGRVPIERPVWRAPVEVSSDRLALR